MRRKAVGRLRVKWKMSERRACRLAGISRSVKRYRHKGRNDKELRKRMQELAQEHPRYGHPMLHAILRKEGLVLNRKRSYRIYREEGLSVRRKKRGKIRRDRVAMPVPSCAGERWSMDFVWDQLACGRRFKVLNVIDEYTRECVVQVADTSIGGKRVARALSASERTLPKSIVCDNGTEFTSKAMFDWAKENKVSLSFIRPGKPVDNAFVESFNGKFREGCLDQHWFANLKEANRLIESWRVHYNTERPHSSLGYMPPAAFAEKAA